MQYQATSPDDYISQLPEDRQEPIKKLRQIISDNLSKGFYCCVSYGNVCEKRIA